MANINLVQGKITEHFTLNEAFNKQTGTIKLTPEQWKKIQEHYNRLERFRLWYGKAMTVNIGYRTAEYNKAVGGTKNSSHLSGLGTDVAVTCSLDEFKRRAKKWKEICEEDGVVGECGLYTWGIHYGSNITYQKTFNLWDARSGSIKYISF